jgi:sugar (pentulose or hexulose) kinase
MRYIAVDLGTTNTKVAAYNEDMKMLALESSPVRYVRNGDYVEFDVEQYYQGLLCTIHRCVVTAFPDEREPAQVILTGQAESLVVCGRHGEPLRNGISWLDNRSVNECHELQSIFKKSLYYPVTGQVSIVPTWPATKLLHLRRNEPGVFAQADKFLLLKDFILLRLTRELCGERSIYNFSFYFDVHKKQYWQEMLDYCEIRADRLPPLVDPCTVVGRLTNEAAMQTGLGADTTVNAGTLDHFAGMIGTGNVRPGIVSESTGTVMTVATLALGLDGCGTGIPFHVGPLPGSSVVMAVCESGGVCYEWFRNNFLPEMSFDEINREIALRKQPNELIFLPGIAGTNAPAYDEHACGVFYGLKMKHDRIDMAYAVLEGVAHLLADNIESFQQAGLNPGTILSTGGGSRSDLWCQLKADLTGHMVVVPEANEAACLGAAIIGAVSSGRFSSYEEAVGQSVVMNKQFTPRMDAKFGAKHTLYQVLNTICF